MYDTYIIQDNDTIDLIASKYKTTPDVLYQLNGVNLDIRPGTSLLVPTRVSELFDYYKINKGDTLYKIANNNNINPDLLAQLNGINKTDYIYPDQVLLIPKSGSILYFTASGDTLDEIADGLGVSIMDLILQNEKIYLQPEQLIVYKYK